MPKIIAIYGQDGTGKTTLTYALADCLGQQNRLVLIVHTDFSKPVLHERMPENQDAVSLGQILLTGDYANISRSFIRFKGNKNVYVTGILNNENFLSYREPSEETAKAYYQAVSKLFDYVLVDTMDSVDDRMALCGLSEANHIVELVYPNIQGIIHQRAFEPVREDMHTGGKTIYAAAKTRPCHNVSLVEKTLGITFNIRLPFSEEVDGCNLKGEPVKGCVGKPGRNYEKELSQLQELVG